MPEVRVVKVTVGFDTNYAPGGVLVDLTGEVAELYFASAYSVPDGWAVDIDGALFDVGKFRVKLMGPQAGKGGAPMAELPKGSDVSSVTVVLAAMGKALQ